MISRRLKAIANYIEKTDKVIDVGCDHALLDIYLVQNKHLNKIIISDLSSNALNQGIENIKKYKLENKIEPRLGNGLETLEPNDNVDTVIISGMGTHTILDILKNKNLANIKKLVIQSNNDYPLLRKKVTEYGFKITKEEAIIDKNKFYIIIVFEKGYKTISDNEINYGTKDMINKETYYKYLLEKKKRIINQKSM